MPTIMAYIESIQAEGTMLPEFINNLSTAAKVRISAGYQSANVIGNFSFELSVEEAREYYIGQALNIVIAEAPRAVLPTPAREQ